MARISQAPTPRDLTGAAGVLQKKYSEDIRGLQGKTISTLEDGVVGGLE